MEMGIDTSIWEIGGLNFPIRLRAKPLTDGEMGSADALFSVVLASLIDVRPCHGMWEIQRASKTIPKADGANYASALSRVWASLPTGPFGQEVDLSRLIGEILKTRDIDGDEVQKEPGSLEPLREQSDCVNIILPRDETSVHQKVSHPHDALLTKIFHDRPRKEPGFRLEHGYKGKACPSMPKSSGSMTAFSSQRLSDFKGKKPILSEAVALVEPTTKTHAWTKKETPDLEVQSSPPRVQSFGHEISSVDLKDLPVYSLKIQTAWEPRGDGFKAFTGKSAEVAEILAKAAKRELPKSVEFKLDPPGLGRLRVVIASKGEDVCVRFFSSTHGCHRALLESESVLAQALSEKGLSLAGFFVDQGMHGRFNRSRQEFKEPDWPQKKTQIHGYDGIQQEVVCEETMINRGILDYRI